LSLSFDVEPDAPPYLNTLRGVDEGLPRLLDLLDELRVRATFFFDAKVAEGRERLVKEVVDRGHELGSHGYGHVRLDRVSREEALGLIDRSLRALRRFSEVASFRAPNLKLPRPLSKDLVTLGVEVDSSVASYKPPFVRHPFCYGGLLRVPVSVTSSVLRVPHSHELLRLTLRNSYIVLFAHPWEFVRLRHWRPDIWLWTGPGLYLKLKNIVKAYVERGYDVITIREARGLVIRCGDGEA